jgi:hypothetical protein
MSAPFHAVKKSRGREGYDASMSSPQGRGLFLAIVVAFAARFAWPASAIPAVPMALTSGQIVEQIQQHNKARSDELKQYKALRHYQVEYRGFAAKIGAKMDVEVNYDAATGKSFHIVSQSGSHLLCEKVLKRAVDSEKEASQDKASTALTEANYRFRLVGNEIVSGRPAYILDVQPITATKFLYRGKIWVDAADFAVVKMETEPAKNPSFWISRTLIHSTSTETDGFWLPQQLRSETRVRIGGTAVLTIDYGSYEVVPEVASLGTAP